MDNNAIDAMIMAFSVFVFVFAISVSMFAFSQINTVSQLMLFRSDKTNYYDNIRIAKPEIDGTYTVMTDTDEEHSHFYDEQGITEVLTTRIVGVETIIPTLYRYYKENFCVKIYDVDNNLLQIFDVDLEGRVRKACAMTEVELNKPENKRFKALKDRYGSTPPTGIGVNLFEAPWIGNTVRDTKTRIDFYINGKSGYINNTFVDYDGKGLLQNYAGRSFRETFVEYVFSGDTIIAKDTSATGEAEIESIESITGNTKELSKIIITYIMQPES